MNISQILHQYNNPIHPDLPLTEAEAEAQIQALFNSKLNKIVSEIEGEKNFTYIHTEAHEDVIDSRAEGFNQALDTAISIIQNNKETK